MADLLEPKVGDFLVYTLWTDTRGFEVTGLTTKGIKVRPTFDGAVVKKENVGGNPWPCIWEEMLSDPTSEERLLLRRGDGTFRVDTSAKPLRPAPVIDGKPCTYTDYRE